MFRNGQQNIAAELQVTDLQTIPSTETADALVQANVADLSSGSHPSPFPTALVALQEHFPRNFLIPTKSHFRGKAYFSKEIGRNENDFRRKVLSYGNRPRNSLIANTLPPRVKVAYYGPSVSDSNINFCVVLYSEHT